MLRISSILLLSILVVFCKDSKRPEIAEKVNVEDTLELVWSDEFDYTGLPDSSKWSYDVGDACEKPAGCGWGNQELQYYTDSRLKNARVEDGNLVIEVHKEKYETRDYTSARLVTKNKGDWKYGRFVIRARLAQGKGVWSAIWMLSTENKYKGWPHSGEIDIMENVGFDPDSLISTVHTLNYYHTIGTHKNGGLKEAGSSDEFHDYILVWNEQECKFYVDETLIFTFENEHTDYKSWPFDEKFHLILNVAYGGNWGGREGISPELLPSRMEVDYVRVYQ